MSGRDRGDDDGGEQRRTPPAMFDPSLSKQAAAAQSRGNGDDSDNDSTGDNTQEGTVSAEAVQQHIDEEEQHRTLYTARQQQALQILHEARDLIFVAASASSTTHSRASSQDLVVGSPDGDSGVVAMTAGAVLPATATFPFRYPATAGHSTLTTLRVSLQAAGAQRYSAAGAAMLAECAGVDNGTLDAQLALNMNAAFTHINRLIHRVEDRTSRVLVTGDVNAGKSTLINALLRQDILQTDQQPCTSAMYEVCEPMDGEEEGEVRAVHDTANYDPHDVRTYTPFTREHLKSADLHSMSGATSVSDLSTWRVVCRDNRPASANLLSNGLVNVTFIDTPGLNRDIAHTMSVQARQATIDAVIFVVNAENHFTLSGVEFIEETRHEKPFIFIAVNRFDVIYDKEKCRRRVLEQIEKILPETAANADELVHFISARDIAMQFSEELAGRHAEHHFRHSQQSVVAFANFEACLRSFLLEKRLKSKLQPIKTYLSNLLTDMISLSRSNQQLAQSELDKAERALALVSPGLAAMQLFHDSFTDTVGTAADELSAAIHAHGRASLERLMVQTAPTVRDVPYPGLLRIWSYVDAVVDRLNDSLCHELMEHYDFSRSRALQSAFGLYQLADESVPGWKEHWTGTNRDPYSPLLAIKDAKRQAGDEAVLNIHLNWLDLVEVPAPSVAMSTFAVGSASVLVSGVIGFRRVARGAVHIGGLIGINSAYTFLVASATAVGVGAGAFIMWDVKGTVQRRVIRKARHQLRYGEQRIHRPFKRVQFVTDKAMREIAFSFQKTAGAVKENLDSQVQQQAQVAQQAESRRSYFADIAERADGLLGAVRALDTVGTPIQVRSGILQRVCAIGRMLHAAEP